jgi:hypothetical protein
MRPAGARKPQELHWSRRISLPILGSQHDQVRVLDSGLENQHVSKVQLDVTKLHHRHFEMVDLVLGSGVDSKKPSENKRRGAPKVRTGCKTCKQTASDRSDFG